MKVGITGGIGAGKSAVCKYVEVLGYPVYYADDRAKEIIVAHQTVRARIIALLGQEAYTSEGYNRAWVSRQVFSSPEKLAKLNSIVHPAVKEDFSLWASAQTAPIIFKEAAIMLEQSAAERNVDVVVAVMAPRAERLIRIQQRDPQRSASEIQKIIDRQMPEAQMTALADVIINNGDHDALIPQINDLIAHLSKSAGKLI